MSKWLIDYDSTLADTGLARVTWINKEFGTQYSTDGITHWHNKDSGYMDESHDLASWSAACFLNNEWQAAVPPIPYAIEGMNRLLDAGEELMIVSDRPPALFEVTRDWLDRQGLDTVRLLFTKHKHSASGDVADALTKLQAAYLYQLRYVVEDAPHHSLNLAEKPYVKKVFLLDTPYNQGVEHEKIQRVKDWREINP